jgi:hypothetical protein
MIETNGYIGLIRCLDEGLGYAPRFKKKKKKKKSLPFRLPTLTSLTSSGKVSFEPHLDKKNDKIRRKRQLGTGSALSKTIPRRLREPYHWFRRHWYIC